MNHNDKNNTDEFYWECEFRKDDARINSCMCEIPAVIDLPGEDELLMKRVQKQPAEYVKGMQRWNDSFFEDLFFELDDVSFPENWQEREGADIYYELEKLTEWWCRFFAENSTEQSLKIICYYGNVMGFATDLVGFGEEKTPGLKIALCKRLYAGVNNIISAVTEIKPRDNKISVHLEELFQLRQKVLNIRFNVEL